MKNNSRTVILCAVSAFLLLQILPRKHAEQNMFKTQEEILTSYGAPVNFLTFHSVKILTSEKINHLGSSYSARALATNAVVLVVSVLILCFLLRWEANRPVVSWSIILLVIGVSAFCGKIPSLRKKARLAHRIEYAHNAITCVDAWSLDKDWIDGQKEVVKSQEASKDFGSPWITDHFMLLENGEWFVFYQGVRKTDNSIDDMLVMKGSNGEWYFTDKHICVDMWMFRFYGETQYEDINVVVNESDFKLEAFTCKDKLFERAILYRRW